ncbi:hypothetical protein O1L55_32875 [Streptomyces albulus]|nr:hypothetical protein [Streptomyces noursei]
MYVGLCSKRSKNHNRCCADDNGNTSGRARTASAGRATTPSRDNRSTKPATVGAANNARTPNSTPNTDRIRPINRVAFSECPPNAKKLSSGSTLRHAEHLREQTAQQLLPHRPRPPRRTALSARHRRGFATLRTLTQFGTALFTAPEQGPFLLRGLEDLRPRHAGVRVPRHRVHHPHEQAVQCLGRGGVEEVGGED